MSKNQPPSNARNAIIDMAKGHAIERAPPPRCVWTPCQGDWLKSSRNNEVRGLVSRQTEVIRFY
jgi:hypothetical protein